jgi:peptidyl-prolyl cis-trans isomerase-like 1
MKKRNLKAYSLSKMTASESGAKGSGSTTAASSSGTSAPPLSQPAVSTCRVITFHTTAGAFSIELYDALAPRLTQHMYELARSHGYDNTLFHKLVPGQYLQGGAAVASSSFASSSASLQQLLAVFQDDEIHHALRFTGAGVVGFANAGPDLNSSQFFITLSPQPKFDGVFSVVGRISTGMKVLQTLSSHYEVDPSTFAPYNPIRITHCSCGVYPKQRRPRVVTLEQQRKRARADDNVEGGRPEGEVLLGGGGDVTAGVTVFKPLALFSAYA